MGKSGSYVLLIEMPCQKQISVGSLGPVSFAKGFYAYTGSALNGLEARISRHLRLKKKMRWHIDFLLAHALLKEVFVWESVYKIECYIAGMLSQKFSFIRRFGCSDCRCPSHLHYCQQESKLKEEICRLGGKIFTQVNIP